MVVKGLTHTNQWSIRKGWVLRYISALVETFTITAPEQKRATLSGPVLTRKIPENKYKSLSKTIQIISVKSFFFQKNTLTW